MAVKSGMHMQNLISSFRKAPRSKYRNTNPVLWALRRRNEASNVAYGDELGRFLNIITINQNFRITPHLLKVRTIALLLNKSFSCQKIFIKLVISMSEFYNLPTYLTNAKLKLWVIFILNISYQLHILYTTQINYKFLKSFKNDSLYISVSYVCPSGKLGERK